MTNKLEISENSLQLRAIRVKLQNMFMKFKLHKGKNKGETSFGRNGNGQGKNRATF